MAVQVAPLSVDLKLNGHVHVVVEDAEKFNAVPDVVRVKVPVGCSNIPEINVFEREEKKQARRTQKVRFYVKHETKSKHRNHGATRCKTHTVRWGRSLRWG
jgi:hypothetical protein